MSAHIITPRMACLVREECWRDMNAHAIASGNGSLTRKFACGFEVAGTVSGCKRLPRYAAPENAPKQLTMQLPFK